jgi:ferredoxin
MPHVITEACQGTKDTGCVDVCSTDAIHPRPDEEGFEEATQLYIDPDACIDCGMCSEECPAEAIYADDELPEGMEKYAQINAEHFANA